MSTEKPIFGQPVLIREPKAKRHAKTGVTIDTSPVLSLFDKPDAQGRLSIGENVNLGEEPVAYSPAIEHWKKKYREAVAETRMDPEVAMITYQAFFFAEAVDMVDPMIKGLKEKIEKHEELTMEEPFYLYPDFFRRKLLSTDLRAENFLRYGLISLRMDRVLSAPNLAGAFNTIGFDLLEAAETASPRNPKYKLGLWREYERKMDERRIKRQKEKENEKETSLNIAVFSMQNARETFGYGTPQYYRQEIERWQNLFDAIADRRKIDHILFQKEYVKWVKFGRMNRDTRNYNGNKIMFRPVDFREAYRNDDPNAFLMGITGLYGIRKDQLREKVVEPSAFKLLSKAVELPPAPKFTHKWPQPYQAWVIYVIVKEYYRLLGLTKIVSKPESKKREFLDNHLRVNQQRYTETYRRMYGRDPEPVPEVHKPLFETKKDNKDEIPF